MDYVPGFASGFFLKKPRSKFFKIQRGFHLHLGLITFYPLYWGSDHRHPYLLISLCGKSFHPAPDNFETGQSSNKPVKAKLHRRKRRDSPLQILLLPANPKLCKK